MLATAVVDNLVVAADPYAREASVFYWERGRPSTLAVVDAVVRADDPQLVELGKKLLAEPADPRAYAVLRSALIDRAGHADQRRRLAPIFDAAWSAECVSRLGYHVGPRYEPAAPVIAADD